MTVPLDDAVLVRSAASGDKAAWAALVDRFGGLVWSVARGYRLGFADAEEVFQTTWLRFAENVSRLREPDRVGAWLATTARHESLKLIRLAARSLTTHDAYLMERASDEPSPEDAVLESEDGAERLRRARLMWSAFQQLPARCQQLLRLLIAVPPPSYAEIAATLGIAIGSIGPTRGRCLQQLRVQLADSEAAGSPVHP
jgi:RNA polymerase sigma factor (sigma-70 family)